MKIIVLKNGEEHEEYLPVAGALCGRRLARVVLYGGDFADLAKAPPEMIKAWAEHMSTKFPPGAENERGR